MTPSKASWLRARRLERAELRLDDLRHYDQKWVSGWRLGARPSEIASVKRQIERAERKVQTLQSDRSVLRSVAAWPTRRVEMIPAWLFVIFCMGGGVLGNILAEAIGL